MKTNTWNSRRRFLGLTEDRMAAALSALVLFLDRQAGRDLPKGGLKRGRWAPDASEACPCCRPESLPRSSDPMAVRAHARSLKHCENLFHANHADVEAVRSEADRIGLRLRAKSALLDLLAHQDSLLLERSARRNQLGIPCYFQDVFNLQDLANLLRYGESFRMRSGRVVDNQDVEVDQETGWIQVRKDPWPVWRNRHRSRDSSPE